MLVQVITIQKSYNVERVAFIMYRVQCDYFADLMKKEAAKVNMYAHIACLDFLKHASVYQYNVYTISSFRTIISFVDYLDILMLVQFSRSMGILQPQHDWLIFNLNKAEERAMKKEFPEFFYHTIRSKFQLVNTLYPMTKNV